MSNAAHIGLEEIVNKGVKLTPMMEQYYNIARQYPGILLMFRMGDFYELFFEDAKNASKILNISLTHRGKLGGYPIPMAGIPHHAAATYIDRLTGAGLKVAICEQVEDPKQAKGIVKRAVTQVVSPGMPFDLDKAESKENKFMASAIEFKGMIYASFIDYTTGDFFGITASNEKEFLEKVQIYKPEEFICYLGQWDNSEFISEYFETQDILQTHLSEDYFDEKYTDVYIEKLIPTYKRDEILKLNSPIISSIGALSYYICSTQSIDSVSHLSPFQMLNTLSDMKITYPTLVGLEIFPKSKENYQNSILGFVDKTKTSMGTRYLKTLFQAPLYNKEQIERRFNTVEYFINNFDKLENIREILDDVRDIERIMAKVSTGKVNGSDLLNLARSNDAYTKIMDIVKKDISGCVLPFSKKTKSALKELEDKIFLTINDEIGANLDKGNLIKEGADKKRDKLAKLSKNAASSLLELEAKYRELTGISNLKVKHNNVAGYFIEVSKSHTKKVPADFVRRQTLVNSERYQTEELAEFEKEVLSAKDKLHKLERKIFDALVENVKEISFEILTLAKSISKVDVFQSLSFVAYREDFIRPNIHDEKIIDIEQGWHPLIKKSIKDQFINHDITLDNKKYFGLVTGPNMAGKTTVMREIAIIQFLSQVGSFVPAKVANIGLCDYIFSRLGASDDIIKGQSTFMVEMSETAEIIRHATDKSLIILDEIGRGTSTYDGLSIAWSLVEHFVKKTKSLTLFSTHYHELIELVDSLDHAKNLTVKTINENGNVQFLYTLIEQGAAQSFGIHVAKLAGLPKTILNRSSQILSKLEKSQNKSGADIIANDSQLDFFNASAGEQTEPSKIEEKLEDLDPMNMTPMDALNVLIELKKLL
ncbi:MAG: DNA mismatch repair protein MutS [Bacteriovoracaceae bacterium]|nr:DNA mismatch repair protein MutS [Bacteriovoracaceae bacterium]